MFDDALPGLSEHTPEAEVERRLIRPVLDVLGHHYYVQKNVHTPEGQKYPDYSFFANQGKRTSAESQNNPAQFYQGAIAVGEAKRWDRPLDRRIKGPGDPFSNHNPSYQIDFYLLATDKRWGVLTNGRLWRLYHRDLSYRLDVYYEVDLPSLLELDDRAFLYFAAFFSRDAFVADATGQLFLDRAYNQSVAYAATLGDELRDNVYESLRFLAEGFLKHPGNNLAETDLDVIRDNAFTTIYRLLFIFYSESPRKGEFLLPMENASYRDTYSLRSLALEIASKLDADATFSPTATTYWSRLVEVYRLISEGDPHLGIPAYNGGLFDDGKHPFLTEKRVGDSYLAQAIDLLARTQASSKTGRGFVTYGDLGVRELGSIYEGLLEHQPRIAEETMVVIREGNRERVVPVGEAKGKKALDHYYEGQVYLTLHQGERRATGSYYTPDYIVKYIVHNTIGPLLDELREQGKDLLDGILSLKVLDPAMGSGHFLVETTDYLARLLVEALGGEQEIEEDDVRWARREVVERCIYGVDLNPLAVELAKLSLWLNTVSRDKPLNFLDHHLRCGNSLIGAWVEQLGVLPDPKNKSKPQTAGTTLAGHRFTMAVAGAVNGFYEIMEAPSDTIDDIRLKEDAHRTARYALQPIKDIADIWTSLYFGNEVKDTVAYESLLQSAEFGGVDWPVAGQIFWLDEARRIGEATRFFHWELEFPEVFFDRKGQQLANPGFSAIVGNPPYDVLSEKEQGFDVESDKAFYSICPALVPALGSKLNFYRLFVAQSVGLSRPDGYHGFIVPMALIGDSQAAPLRRHLLTETRILIVEAFPQKNDPANRVFPDAKLSTCLYVLKKSKCDVFQLRIHPGRLILESSPTIYISRDDLELFDPDGLSIPSYPGATARDIALAVKLSRVCFGHRFEDVAPSRQGEVNLTTHSVYLSDSPQGPEVLRGAHVDRFVFNYEPKQGKPKYLLVNQYLKGKAPRSKAFDHKEIRIGYQRGAAIDNWRRIIACVIGQGQFCSDTINYIVRTKYDFFFILGLLNSALYEWRFRLTSTNNHVNSYEVDALPLRPIEFLTAQADREHFGKEVKHLYKQGVTTDDFADLLHFVDRLLSRDKDAASPMDMEHSDVVHDLVAFLAAELIRLNEEQQTEIKQFLDWLESYLGTSIDELQNKTKLKDYWRPEVDWNTLLNILVQNGHRVTKVKLPGYQDEQPIREGFETSKVNLQPLLAYSRRTDRLIDQIVYKLYGLTEEEISIVEGSTSVLP